MAEEKKKSRKGTVFLVLGVLCLVGALGFASFNWVDEWRAGQAAGDIMSQLAAQQDDGKGKSDEKSLADYKEDTKKVDGREYIGSLQIPSLGLDLPVAAKWNYDNLNVAPCRYEGSISKGHMIIAGHNYSTHFGRLSELPKGSKIVFTDVHKRRFTYKVKKTEVLSKFSVKEMNAGDWDLTLFTCTWSGECRTSVRCKMVSDGLK